MVRHLVTVQQGQGAEAAPARLEGTAVVGRARLPVLLAVVRLEGGAVGQLTAAPIVRARVLHQYTCEHNTSRITNLTYLCVLIELYLIQLSLQDLVYFDAV